MTHERNTHCARISLLALNSTVARDEYRAYHTVYVHREPSHVNVYLYVSAASARRVMRAQERIVGKGTLAASGEAQRGNNEHAPD